MDYKTVAKSKSSNGAVISKTQKIYNKKSQSNAAFQPLTMKKRGVYVEKKVKSSTNAQEANGIEIKKKAPPRPRPGQKKFLASVLTILSKSTTGTQYPDIQEEDRTKVKRYKPRWKINDAVQSSNNEQFNKVNKTKKSKFKSRVLNEEMLRAEKEQLIILQSKKDITQTPSNYSAKSKAATESIKWSDVLQENELLKTNPIRDILENDIYSGVAEGITKEVLEGRTEDKKLRINDDPITLASEIAKKDDKQLYNFFVDLLKTTISVYNVKTDCDTRDGSKIVLEINDSIAKKLEFKKESHEKVNLIKRNRIDEAEKHAYHGKENIPIDIKLSEYEPTGSFKRKIRAKSFFCPYTRKVKIPSKSNSFELKKNIRRPKKKALLSLLKEQLEMDTYSFEEPESLYDALKVMARNKQRCEKSIRFNKKTNINKDIDSECMFKRRKVLSFKAKRKGKSKHNTPTELSTRYDEEVKRTSFPSNHSLEVYGYDYEEPIKRLEEPKHRRVIFTYHSSPSGSDSNLDDCNALIDYPDSTASSNYSVFN